MAHTTLEPNPAMLPNLSKGYEVHGEEIDTETPQREHQGRGFRVPGGALYTTVGDLAGLASFLLGELPGGASKMMMLQRGFWQPRVILKIKNGKLVGKTYEFHVPRRFLVG